MRYLIFLLVLGGCASIDRESIERIGRSKKLTLIEGEQGQAIVLKRDKDCHCAMVQFEWRF